MKIQLPYEHLQIGWAVLGSLLLPLPILVVAARLTSSVAPLGLAGIILVVTAALFGTLKVRVDRASISLRFGVGLIRRTVSVADVKTFGEVENPWYYGWGIRYFPGGTLYNVSGLAAVELVMSDGRRIRVGSDDSATLFLALESVIGSPAPLSEFPLVSGARAPTKVRWVVLGSLLPVLLVLPVLLHYQARPPVVSLTPDAVTIDNLFYGQRYALSDIKRVELVPVLPRIRLRTNGYAAGGTLRGWFSVDQWGQGKMFVEVSQPPYVVMFLQDGFVAVNYREPVETQRLFGALRQLVPTKLLQVDTATKRR